LPPGLQLERPGFWLCTGDTGNTGDTGDTSPPPECEKDSDCPDDGNECTGAYCDDDGFCKVEYYGGDVSCDDGVFCNGEDYCNGSGQCVASGEDPCYPYVCSESSEKCCDPGYAGEDCSVCVRFTDISNSSPEQDGMSWETSFSNLKSSLKSASDAVGLETWPDRCEVWVAEGRYHVYEGSRDDTLDVMSGVLLYGGFSGVESRKEERDIRENETTIDGRDSAENNRVYHILTPRSKTVIDGFRVVAGVADEGGWGADEVNGGGVYAENREEIELRNMFFVANGAKEVGGAVYFTGGGGHLIKNCYFYGNSCDERGGAVAFDNRSSGILQNVVFYNNYAGDYGGGLYVRDESTVTVYNSTFNGNGADSGNAGAALHAYDSSNVSVVNSIFWGNTLGNEIQANGSSKVNVSFTDINKDACGSDSNSDINFSDIITEDPLFLDAENGNLNIGINSSCVDAGTSEGDVPEKDIRGLPRDLSPDMGAFEVQK
ncbi:MAG: right-handed parallel beta-helix repeat-containing protein, partial [bacterium]